MTEAGPKIAVPVKPPTKENFEAESNTAKRFSLEQMRTLQNMHERTVSTFEAKISSMLRAVIDFKLTDIEQLRYTGHCDSKSSVSNICYTAI